MGNISTLAVDASYEVLTGDLSYTLVRCEARPLTAGLAPALAKLLAEVTVVSSEEQMLALEVLRAEVRVALVDEDIDGTVDAVVNNILIITGGDRTHEMYVHFMDGITPGELKSPILAEELSTVRLWVPSLAASPFSSLAALGPILAQQVADADVAKAKLDAATQALKQFREVGARKALVDKINAKRKTTFGELGGMAHASPELNLPKDFADRFFLHSTRRRRRPTSKEVQAKLDAAKEAVADLEAKLAEVEADEKAEADRQAKRNATAHQKKIADAQKKADASAAALAALQKQSTP